MYHVLNSRNSYFFIEDNKRVIASAGCFRVSSSAAEIKHVVVSPLYRNNGLARRLIGHIIEETASDFFYATIRTDNKSSINCFKNLGFRISSMRDLKSGPIYLVTRSKYDSSRCNDTTF